MATNLKVYIHGRPQGADVWCSGDYNSSDRLYIDPYLDSKIGLDAESVLIVDTYDTDTFYTYLRRKNVFEYSRAQGYFAITLRVSGGYCRNVSSICSLLDKVFEQKCLNTILKKEDGIYRYIIRRFTEKEEDIREIVTLINSNFQHILEPFMVSADCKSNTLGTNPTKYSFQEVDSPAFFDEAHKTKIVVSQDYPTKASLQAIELNRVQAQLNDLSGKLESASKQARDAYLGQIKEKEQLLNQKQAEIDCLNREISRIAQENEKLKSEKKKVHKQPKELYTDVKEPCISDARLVAGRFPDDGQTTDGSTHSNDKKKYKIHLPTKWLTWLNTISIIVVSIMFGMTTRGLRNAVTNIESKNSWKYGNESTPQEKGGELPNVVTSIYTFPFVVDIEEYDTGELKRGKEYTLRVKPNENECKNLGINTDKVKNLERCLSELLGNSFVINCNGQEVSNGSRTLLASQDMKGDTVEVGGNIVIIALKIEERKLSVQK